MNLSPAGANAILDGSASMGATLYMQLHTNDPGPDGTDNVSVESTRQPFTRAAASGGACSNDDIIQWSPAGTEESHTHATIWSAVSGGLCWWIGALANPVPVGVGGYMVIDPGELDLSLDVWA